MNRPLDRFFQMTIIFSFCRENDGELENRELHNGLPGRDGISLLILFTTAQDRKIFQMMVTGIAVNYFQ